MAREPDKPRRQAPRPAAGGRGREPRAGRAAQAARRREEDAFDHVAGLPAVAALYAAAPERIERLYFVEGLKAEVGHICVALARSHRPYRLVRPDELERIAGTAMHGGVVVFARPRPLAVLDTAEAAAWAAAGEPLLVLDGVGNPHNLGAIARTAAFFGLARLVLSDHPGQARPSDAATRVAKGGLEHLAVYRVQRLPEALRRLKAAGYLVLGTALEKGEPPERWLASRRPVALVLGNEEEGLPPPTLAACEAVVTLPGSGRVQSLNVAATAAILIHALAGRR